VTVEGQSLARSLGSDCIESDATALLVANGFQIEDAEGPDSDDDNISPEVLVRILRMKLDAMKDGREFPRVTRKDVICGATTFYSLIGTRELVTVFEPFESAMARTRKRATLEAIAELETMIVEAESLVVAESEIRSLFAVA
jgi:hypothetical protein